MISDLLHTLTLYIFPGILLGLSICLFFFSIPEKAGLDNYRIARRVMGYAYLLYSLGLFMKHYGISENENPLLFRLLILIISYSQALLFTYTLITLVNIKFVNIGRVMKEVLPVAVVSAGMFLLYAHASAAVFKVALHVFDLFYLLALFRYVILFRRQYCSYVAQMDSFFSNEESRRLQWVSVSFYAALGIGILALVYAVFPTEVATLVFMSIALVFYAVFGIRFVNYAFSFQSFEKAIENECVTTETEDPAPDEKELELISRIDTLMAEQQPFRNPDLSVEEIAAMLDKKYRSVSEAINRCRGMNFKTYVNGFRVAEAVRLMTEDKGNRLTIDAIAYDSGFTDRSNFYRVFKKHKGISPSDFRKKDRQKRI